MGFIRGVDGHWFIDTDGRRCLLRGVNLGGSSKVPSRLDGPLVHPDNFQDHRNVSFIDRPFPLADAGEHFQHLRDWGFNCLRLLTTWEAVEHTGPGVYDEAYLDYIRALVKRAGEFGFTVFIDPHQDVWSRMTGGDGAPGWTLELAGFDPSQLDASEAAVCMENRYPAYDSTYWHLNRQRLACATMFTLFFAGDRFAPGLTVGGVSIQEYLQSHFIQSILQVVRRVSDLPCVIGYDSFNEPDPGYIGLEDLSATRIMFADGPLITPFESMFIPAGIPHTVPWIEFDGFMPSQTRETLLNPDRTCAWRNPTEDIWRKQGVWSLDAEGKPRLEKKDAFAGVSFFQDCLRPFIRRYAEAVRAVHPGALIFVEGQPGSQESISIGDDIPVVNASHWYDAVTVHTRHYDPARTLEFGTFMLVEGEEAVRKLFAHQIGLIVGMSKSRLNNAPTLIGEFGVPFDLDGGASFTSESYRQQAKALTVYYDALDAHLAHAALWNYTADNTHQWGDQWNREDLSIISRDDFHAGDGIYAGARAAEGFCRPHLEAAAGTPLLQSFDQAAGVFTLKINADPKVKAPSTVFVPAIQYPRGVHLEISSGTVEYNEKEQRLLWRNPDPGVQILTITRITKE